MSNFLEGVGNSLKNTWCGYSYSDFVVAGLVAGSPLALGQPVGSLAVAGVVTKGLGRLRDASDGWCSKGQSGGGGAGGMWDSPPAPFEGGQCEGYWYRYTSVVNWRRLSDGLTGEETNTTWASLGILSNPEITNWQANPRGTFQITTNSGAATKVLFRTNQLGPGGQAHEIVDARIENVRKDLTIPGGATDSAEDDCGDPVSDVQPVPKIDDSIDIDYDDDDGNPVTLPSNPIEWFPPCFSPTGVKLPFKVQTPLGDVCGKANFGLDSIGLGSNITPEIEFSQCRDNDLALPPVTPANEVFSLSGPMGSGSAEPDSELVGSAIGSFDPETEKPILGVLVVGARENMDRLDQTKVIGSLSQEFPPLLYPDICSVRFLLILETENGTSFSYSQPQRVQQVQSYVPCPSQFGAAAVEVLWRPGWNGTYQEARRKSCCDKCASADPALPDELDRCA